MSSQKPSINSSANINSIAESSTKLIFPYENELRKIIPLWMKFYCYEFTSAAIGRATTRSRSIGGVGNSIPVFTKEKAQIFIPAPVNFTSNTAHNYTGQPTSAIAVFPGIVDEIAKQAKQIFPDQVGNLEAILNAIIQGIETTGTYSGMISGMYSELSKAEIIDTQYTPHGPSRTYEIKVNMPCLTERDSIIAGSVIRAFEALSMPTMRSILGIASATKYYHPPLWVFGIGPKDSFTFDPDWSGFPQLSVLRNVSHRKTAYDTNSLSAIGKAGLLKPVAYSLSLIFQELEPAFRETNAAGSVGLNIINRSTALVSSGDRTPVRITGL